MASGSGSSVNPLPQCKSNYKLQGDCCIQNVLNLNGCKLNFGTVEVVTQLTELSCLSNVELSINDQSVYDRYHECNYGIVAVTTTNSIPFSTAKGHSDVS